jgi:hypothetical protein
MALRALLRFGFQRYSSTYSDSWLLNSTFEACID